MDWFLCFSSQSTHYAHKSIKWQLGFYWAELYVEKRQLSTKCNHLILVSYCYILKITAKSLQPPNIRWIYKGSKNQNAHPLFIPVVKAKNKAKMLRINSEYWRLKVTRMLMKCNKWILPLCIRTQKAGLPSLRHA